MPRKAPNTPTADETDVGQTFQVVITQDEDGWFIGKVPTLPGCHTQGRTVDQVKERIKEAILLCLDDQPLHERFVGVETVTVEA
jgi:predicted RNase H-like HicB family nuclease